MKETARRLRAEDAKRWTQQRVAEALGVGQQTVSDWFHSPRNTSNTGSGNACDAQPAEGRDLAAADDVATAPVPFHQPECSIVSRP